MKCSSVNELALKTNFCCLHESKQNLTILLAIDTNSGFYFFFLSHVDLWIAEDFLLLPGPFI